VTVGFPEAEIFGIKLVNGRPTKALVDFTNHEQGPIQVAFIAGALLNPEPLAPELPPWAAVVRNLTTSKYELDIPAGEKASLTYNFVTDLNPQDLNLNLIAVIASKGAVYQVQAFNGTVSVIEAATSLFDPQMYTSPSHPCYQIELRSN
jgi:hypothetical protein